LNPNGFKAFCFIQKSDGITKIQKKRTKKRTTLKKRAKKSLMHRERKGAYQWQISEKTRRMARLFPIASPLVWKEMWLPAQIRGGDAKPSTVASLTSFMSKRVPPQCKCCTGAELFMRY